jgi:hypothetical protein
MVEVCILVIVTGMLGSSYTHMHNMSLTLSWIFPGGFFLPNAVPGLSACFAFRPKVCRIGRRT